MGFIKEFFNFGMSAAQRHELYRAVFKDDRDTLLKLSRRYGSDARYHITQAKAESYKFLGAAARNDIKAVEAFLKKYGDDCINVSSGRNETILYKAVFSSKADISLINLLISKGADVNIANMNDITPLMVAVLQGKANVVEVLLTAGADLEKKDWRGKNVFNYHSPCPQVSYLLYNCKIIRQEELLKKQRQEREKLLREFWTVKADDDISQFIKNGQLDKVREFIDCAFFSGDKPKFTSDHLKHAVLREDAAMVRLLITHGARFSKQELELMQEIQDKGFVKNINMLKDCGMKVGSAGVNKKPPAPKL